jgi:ELWxxDGT repeat protein
MTRTAHVPFAALLLAVALPAQTHLVADLNPGIGSSSPNAVAILDDHAIFAGLDGTSVNLYRSDGTAAGTTVIAVLDATPTFAWPSQLVTVGSRVFFAWGDAATGTELWATDGTTGGTGLVKDIRVGTGSSSPASIADIGGIAYFGAATSGSNNELWRSDGTAAGTWMVKEIHSSATVGSFPAAFAQLGTGGTFLFAATDGTSGRELWQSDGTAAGTVLVEDIVPGAGGPLSSNPLFLVPFGDRVAFAALSKLWISDGTAAGTGEISPVAMAPRQLAVQNGKLFFQGFDSPYGTELWTSDGTAGGTAMLADLNPGGVPAIGSFPFVLTPIGSRWVYFSATNAFGEELWRTDGESTHALCHDIRVGSASSSPQANGYPGTHLVNSRFAVTSTGTMFFAANDGTTGIELHVFDTGVLAAAPTYGASCGGLSLTATTPYLGTTVVLTTGGIPATTLGSINVLSLTKYVPPIDLTPAGIDGCWLHTGVESVTALAGYPTATTTFTIPSDPIWLGFELHSQSGSLVPGANPFGLITSNAVTLVIGDL